MLLNIHSMFMESSRIMTSLLMSRDSMQKRLEERLSKERDKKSSAEMDYGTWLNTKQKKIGIF
jgi:hypothetical protein